MVHIPDTELRERMNAAAAAIPVGSLYAHYKHPELPYRIDGFCIIEANDEVGVLYTALYGAGVTFCRPLAVFQETVEHEGARIPRFSLVQDGS